MAHFVTTRTPNFDDASLHEDSLRNHLHDPEITPNHPAKENNLPHDPLPLEEGIRIKTVRIRVAIHPQPLLLGQQGNPFLSQRPNPHGSSIDFSQTLYLEDVKKPLDGKEELNIEKNKVKLFFGF
jgi:hypothetical protein